MPTVQWNATVRCDAARRQIGGIVVPYGIVGRTSMGPLRIAAGAVVLPDDLGRVKLLADHDGAQPIGYGIAATDTADGLDMTFQLPDGAAGDAALADASPDRRLRDGLSIGAELDEYAETDEALEVLSCRLREVSLVSVPAFEDARVNRVAATAQPNGGNAMPEALPPMPARPTQPIGQPITAAAADDLAAGAPAGDVLVAEVLTAGQPPPARPAPRAAPRDLSLAGVSRMLAATGGDFQAVRQTLGQVQAALTNVTTTETAPLVLPQYVNDLLDVINLGTPIIDVFSSSGLTSNPVRFPYWQTLPTIDKQLTQKSQIATGPVLISTMDATPETWAGGNDVAMQVIDWADPDFITLYFQACAAVYATKIESAFETALATFATPLVAGANLVETIGIAMAKIMTSGYAGTPLMVMSGDVWASLFVELAGSGPGLFGIVNPAFPVPRVVVGPYFPAQTLLFGLSSAARSFQNAGAPIRLRAVDVSLLGVDLGVYGYFAAVLLHANALYKITGLPAPPLADAFEAFDQNAYRTPIDLFRPKEGDTPVEQAAPEAAAIETTATTSKSK